jgi:hypothetical protein
MKQKRAGKRGKWCQCCAGENLCRPAGGQEHFTQRDNLFLLSLHIRSKTRKKAAEMRRLSCEMKMFFLIVASVMSMIAAVLIMAVSLDTGMVLRHIDILVPPVAHEVDGVAAGIISVAVPAPVFRMTGRHSHVDRPCNNHGRGPNHDRSRVYDFRLRKASYVDAAIKTGLADTDGHAHIGTLRRRGCNERYHHGK